MTNFNNPIKKCSLCKKIRTIFYRDKDKFQEINLCYECSKLAGFEVDDSGFKTCPRCKDKFKGGTICWVCKQIMNGRIKNETA